MGHFTAIDDPTQRKFYVDEPDEPRAGPLTLLLSLHGGGSVGAWQRQYFPAYLYANAHRLAVATPSCATKEPMRRWDAEADDAHLRNVVGYMVRRYGAANVAGFWLVGHSQGGMTSNRLLNDAFFANRVDGWLSLSGGRIGPIELPPSFFVPVRGPLPPAVAATQPNAPRAGRATPPDADISFIFATGEHEMVALPTTSPWADRYGAGARVRLPDVVDTEPGLIYDTLRDGKSNASWGLRPRPGTAQIYVYPNARGGRVIADVVRLDKGHTEGLEPKITAKLIEMMVAAPGGKLRALA